MLDRLIGLIVRFRRPILGCLAAATLACGLVASQMQYDFTPQALFAGEHELTDFNAQIKEEFGHTDSIVLVVPYAKEQAGADNGDLLTSAALQWQRDLSSALSTVDSVDGLSGLATLSVPRLRPFSQSVIRVPVVPAGPIDRETADLVRSRVEAESTLDGVLISKDRRAAAIVLQLDPTRKDIAHITRVVEKIRAAIREIEPPPGYDLFLGGLPAMRVDIIESLKRDQVTIIPACVVVFALVEVLIFRRWAGVVAPAATIVVGLACTFAALVGLGQALTIISNVLPILLMIVGVSSCVHFLNAYAEQSVISPVDRLRAVREAARHMLPACLLTSLTTALGFLSLMAARSQLLRELGWQAALGIAVFYVATVLVCTTTLPSLRAPASEKSSGQPSPLAAFAWRLGAFSSSHPRLILFLALAGTLYASNRGARVPVDSFIIETYDADHAEVRHMRLIEDKLSGFAPVELILTGSQPDWFVQAENWSRVVKLQSIAAAQPNVLLARSYVDAFRQADELMPGGPPLEELADDEALQPRLTLINRLLQRFAGDDQLRAVVAEDRQTIRITLRVRDSGTQATLRLGKRLAKEFTSLFPNDSGVSMRLTGESYVAAVAINRFIRDLLYSLLGVSALIFVVIGGLLRSVRLAFVSILPNIAPLVITLGYMGARGYPLNLGNVIVFAISLGVAVDDTIHFLARFREEDLRNPGEDVVDTIRRTCLGTGRAVLMTTLLIVCGLALLLTSAFVPTRRFAELTAVTMISALLGDLLLLPALLKLFWRRQREK